MPGEGAARYNSYEGLDVKDKIVLILRYVPEGVEPARRAQLNRYAGLRYKAMMARERGAKAVLVVTGPNSPQRRRTAAADRRRHAAGSGIIAASISGAVADALLAPSGKKLKDLQTALDTENPHAEGGFVLPKVRVKLALGDRAHEERPIATSSPTCRPPNRRADEYIVVGAHYDHLGRGGAAARWRARARKRRFIPARTTTRPASRWSWNSRRRWRRSARSIRRNSGAA